MEISLTLFFINYFDKLSIGLKFHVYSISLFLSLFDLNLSTIIDMQNTQEQKSSMEKDFPDLMIHYK